MKKADLLKLVEKIADDGDINETILGTDEFKNLGKVDLSKLTADQLKTLMEGELGKAYLTSHDDTVRSHAVETFKKGKMQELIKEAVEKAKNPNESPEAKEIRELKEELARERATKSITKMLGDNELPPEWAEFISGKDDEEYKGKIDTITKLINGRAEKIVQSRLLNSSYVPPKGADGGKLTKAEFDKMGYKERNELYKNDKALYDELSQ